MKTICIQYKPGEKDFWAILIYGQDLLFFKKRFSLDSEDIKRLLTSNYCGWFGTDIEYTIYDEKQYRGPLQNIRVGLP